MLKCFKLALHPTLAANEEGKRSKAPMESFKKKGLEVPHMRD